MYWPGGPVCNSCYRRARSSPRPCQVCGQVRVLIAGAPAGTGPVVQLAVCGPCAGSHHSYLCAECGGGGPYKGRVCVRCVVRRVLIEQFTGPAGEMTDQARLVVETMAATRRPRSVIQWLSSQRGGAQILRDVFGRGDDITHELLDTLGGRTVWSLRRTLVDAEILSPRMETIAQLDARIRATADAAAPHHRHLLLMYATWWVLRHAKRQHERTGRFTSSQLRGAHRRVLTAADLLTWLDTQDLTLEHLSQPDLERWIESYPLWMYGADFLRWARRRRITANELRLPPRTTADPEILLSDADRWQLLDRCLHDDQLPLDVRAAGSLLLLYGLPLNRIVELTADQLAPEGLRISRDAPAIATPPALRRLLEQLPAPPRIPSAVALISSTGPDRWLFPGRSIKGHVSPPVVSSHLRRHGISARASRNAALIALAADLPASVLTTLFGLNITTALQWTRRAGRDWHSFIAAAAAQRGGLRPGEF